MAHPAEQTLANDGVMLTEGRRTALNAPAYLGTNRHCLRPNGPALAAPGPPVLRVPPARSGR